MEGSVQPASCPCPPPPIDLFCLRKGSWRVTFFFFGGCKKWAKNVPRNGQPMAKFPVDFFFGKSCQFLFFFPAVLMFLFAIHPGASQKHWEAFCKVDINWYAQDSSERQRYSGATRLQSLCGCYFHQMLFFLCQFKSSFAIKVQSTCPDARFLSSAPEPVQPTDTRPA